ncbi:MAG: succinylglutamate desuccinylase/aspartoacylase family protein [Syntrophobacterales bacterium]|nr:succinylglutamate desuccinylase/aspartoacylase family protein [Syntrophobacterales bacterium]
MANHRRILILTLLVFAFIFLILFIADTLSREKNITVDKGSPGVQVKRFFAGTPQEVTVYFLRGREKGPTLLIFSGIHGDEKGGYLAADRYTNLNVRKGTLVVVPRLNLPAIRKERREGFDGDMNRLFHLPDDSQTLQDSKVVNLAKSLIKDADYVLNVHQGDGFYSPRWVSHKRNPLKWGQCNVIDASSFDLPNGQKLELERFAKTVAARANAKIEDFRYHFLVNNTNTAAGESRHKEQRKSLTYYALSRHNKVALGLEATKSCSLPEAVAFLTAVINSVIEEVGISVVQLPSESPDHIRAEWQMAKGE